MCVSSSIGGAKRFFLAFIIKHYSIIRLQCEQVRKLMTANNKDPLPVAIFGVLVKDDAYMHQRMLVADKYTTYAFATDQSEWPPKIATGVQLSHFETPTITKNTSAF